VENQFQEQNFESMGSTNSHGFEIVVGHYLTKGGSSGCTRVAAAPYWWQLAPRLRQWLLAVALCQPRMVLGRL